jgi:hypothetical protein
MPKIVRDDTKGLYQKAGKGGVGVKIVQVAELTKTAARVYSIASGNGIVQPEKSILTGVTVVVSTALAYSGAATTGIRIGTAAAGEQLMALDADSVAGSGASLAAGKGTSTQSEVATALGGNATAIIVANSPYTATERKLFPEVAIHANAVNSGVLQVFLEFVQFSA